MNPFEILRGSSSEIMHTKPYSRSFSFLRLVFSCEAQLYKFTCPCVCLSVCLFVWLSVCLFVGLPVVGGWLLVVGCCLLLVVCCVLLLLVVVVCCC